MTQKYSWEATAGISEFMALLAINTQRAKALDAEHIIDTFTINHNNRHIVLIWDLKW